MVAEKRSPGNIRELKQRRQPDNENGKNAIGLIRKNNIFARVSRFFVHFFAVAARPRRENGSFHFLWRT